MWRSRSPAVAAAAALVATVACGTRVPAARFDEVAAAGHGRSTSSTASGDDTASAPGTLGTTGDTRAVAPPSGGGTSSDSSGGTTDVGRGTERGGGSRGRTATGTGADDGGDPAPRNHASDVGVTADAIRVGIIVSKGGPLGPRAFAPMSEGTQAYFNWLNARGGINGRRVEVSVCDDAEDPAQNRRCVRQLVDEHEVFALVGNATRAYDGAHHVAEAGVPDVGGQPIGTAYWTYPTHFAIRGSEYARRGEVGYEGKLYGSTAQFEYIQQRVRISRAAVVHYSVSQSEAFGNYLVEGLRRAGVEVQRYSVNAAFPNFDAVVADMQAKQIDAIWDAMDANGNRNLCAAMERKAFAVKAKVQNANGWVRTIADTYSEVCRDALFAITESRPNADTSHPRVAEFREAIRAIYGDAYDRDLHQWTLEGWAAGWLFTDAVESMGADVTREGLIDWLNRQDGYTADGLMPAGIEWVYVDFGKQAPSEACMVPGRWSDEARNLVADSDVPHCIEGVEWLPYEPAG